VNDEILLNCVREKKEMKARQAKHSMESVKSVMSDKSVKNKAERDRFTAQSISE